MDVMNVKLDMLIHLNVVIVTPLAMQRMPSTGHQLVNANVSFTILSTTKQWTAYLVLVPTSLATSLIITNSLHNEALTTVAQVPYLGSEVA